MPALPDAAQAVVDLGKLRDYCLSASHPRGRHKARVFRSRLGLGPDDAAWLRSAILGALRSTEAMQGAADGFGRRYLTDLALMRDGRTAIVRCVWIIRSGERTPRLVTCYVP